MKASQSRGMRIGLWRVLARMMHKREWRWMMLDVFGFRVLGKIWAVMRGCGYGYGYGYGGWNGSVTV